MNFLLFTRSVEIEAELVNNIHQLGHEVFCSRHLTDDSLEDKIPNELFWYFDGIIFSESISNNEMVKLAVKDCIKQTLLYRKVGRDVSERECNECEIHGITILSNSLIGLREDFESNSNGRLEKIPKSLGDISDLRQKVKLSRQEFKVLQSLILDEGKVVSKRQLSKMLWDKEIISPSNQSRISTIVKSMRKKFLSIGINEECIETIWGQGYKLNKRYFKL